MTKQKYDELMGMLKSYDESNLKELFIDLDDPALAERIANVAYAFVETWADKEIEKHELSQNEDALEVDNARRVREL